MNSYGYFRFLVLHLVFSATCLHWVRTQNLQESDADHSADEKSEEEVSWDPERFNEEADQNYNLVFLKYNYRIRPPAFYVEVDLAVTLTHVRHLDVGKQELQTVLDLDLNWIDSRLQWRPDLVKEIHASTDKVWCPDLVYMNGVTPVQHLYPTIVRIIHNGSVSWKRKEIVTTRCDTNPSSNNQSCAIKMGFLTNSPGRDTFFFSGDSTASIDPDAVVFNHKWQLKSLEMDTDEGNQTDAKSTTIDLNLVLEHTKPGVLGGGASGDGGLFTGRTTDTNSLAEANNGGDGGSGGNDAARGGRSSDKQGGGCGCVGGGGGGSIHDIRNVSGMMILSFALGILLVGFLKEEGDGLRR